MLVLPLVIYISATPLLHLYTLYPIPYTVYRIPNALLQWGQYITDIRLYNTYINTNTTPKLRFHYSLLAHTSNYDIDIDINKSTATTLC